MSPYFAYDHMNNWFCGLGLFLHGLFGGFWQIVFWILVVFMGVKLLKAIFNSQVADRESPLDLLRLRYARGEINLEGFEKMKNEIAA